MKSLIPKSEQLLRLDIGTRVAEGVVEDDNLAIDAGKGRGSAGSKARGYFDLASARSEAYELEEDVDSQWGTLEEGTMVIDIEYYWMGYPSSPSKVPHPYYHAPNQPGAFVTVPVEHVLVAGFDMEPLQMPA